MTRYAIITDGIVTNVVEADAASVSSMLAIPSATANIGDHWDGVNFNTPAPVPPPPPSAVTRGQALSAIFLSLGITEDDLIALTLGAPDPQKTLMQIDIRNRLTFERDNPTLAAMAAALGLNSAQLDSLFVLAATL